MASKPQDTTPRYWMGTTPEACDLNPAHKITTKFIDGRMARGSWANMCPACHRTLGVGLGTGRGQEYTKQDDGRWLKTGG